MIRIATPNDADAIGRIRVAAWRAAYQAFMDKSYLDKLDANSNILQLKEQLTTPSSDFIVFVAEESSDVVAFCILGTPRYPTKATAIELWALNVLPEHWQKGIGSRLIQHAINYSSSLDFKALELWCIRSNLPAENAYRKMGFIKSGHERSSSALTGMPLHEDHYTIRFLTRISSDSIDIEAKNKLAHHPKGSHSTGVDEYIVID